MSELNPEPPKTLNEAEQKFSRFLLSQNYPDTIHWLIPGDVLAGAGPHYWVRKRGCQAKEYAALLYAKGVNRNLGILLEAVCATEAETFASVFVPESDEDAQYHLVGPALKLSCPIERPSTTVITNPLRWLWLWYLYGKQSEMLEANQRVQP